MFESRCGVCCSLCERKAAVHCAGCPKMDKPFWGGECGVKACYESRGMEHCGQCGDFPCDTLKGMGGEEGFGPAPKLAKRRAWAQAEKEGNHAA